MSPDEIAAVARQVVAQLRAELGILAPGLLTKGEIAGVLRVEPQTIDRWVRQGMPAEDRASYRLFDRAKCEQWVAGRKKPARPRRGSTTAPSLDGVELRTRKAG